MGRSYAGVLGPLAFLTVVARGLIEGGGVESTIQLAALCLFAFAALGYVLGRTASLVVDDSVRAKLAQRLASRGAPDGNAATNVA